MCAWAKNGEMSVDARRRHQRVERRATDDRCCRCREARDAAACQHPDGVPTIDVARGHSISIPTIARQCYTCVARTPSLLLAVVSSIGTDTGRDTTKSGRNFTRHPARLSALALPLSLSLSLATVLRIGHYCAPSRLILWVQPHNHATTKQTGERAKPKPLHVAAPPEALQRRGT